MTEKRAYSERKTANPALGWKRNDVEEWLRRASPMAAKLYKAGVLRVRLFYWSNPTIKDLTANLRDGKGAKWLSPSADENDPLERAYRAQLGGEVKRNRPDVRGHDRFEWVKIAPNHFWDCENMQTAAALKGGALRIDGASAATPANETEDEKEAAT